MQHQATGLLGCSSNISLVSHGGFDVNPSGFFNTKCCCRCYCCCSSPLQMYNVFVYFCLQPILVEEPTAEECLQLLQGLAPRYETFHDVTISPAAMSAAVAAAQR
jgi:hypothetical protein